MKVSRKILLFILILTGSIAPRCGATVYHSDGSTANVQALVNAARDGDTITLPVGTFSWTQTLVISKGITLQGQTTTANTATNPDNASANDQTIILDDMARPTQSSLLTVDSDNVRVTGITFRHGLS